MNKIDLVKRIFRTQVKRYIPELSLTFLFIILTSLTTAATAWLLDPAIKEIILANDLEFKSRINSPTIRIDNISIAGK